MTQLPDQQGGASTPERPALVDQVIAALRTVYDPEIPVNIYDLGLIYKIDINESARRVHIQMTLTTPNCPMADEIPGRVRSVVERIDAVNDAEVVVVWDPPWDPSKMSEEAKLILGRN